MGQMYRTHKSATCCYCGSKTVLSFGQGARHELQCKACGAPLSRLKARRTDHVEDPFIVSGKKRPPPERGPKKKKKKNQKSIAHRLFDAAEDVFDLFD